MTHEPRARAVVRHPIGLDQHVSASNHTVKRLHRPDRLATSDPLGCNSRALVVRERVSPIRWIPVLRSTPEGSRTLVRRRKIKKRPKQA
eukprot:9778664-Lingulodinium_polyedra.AAC.1